MHIDPRLIIDFVRIAEEGSFTRAARRLRVAQPRLSARLQKLELILGFRLFDRTTRSVSLTERGADFLDIARDVLHACEAADRLALQLKRRDRSVLRIGAAPSTKVIQIRSDLIEAFGLSHPAVSLELETGWSPVLLGRLEAGEIDLSFMMGEVDGARFDSIVLRRYGLALTVQRGHALDGAPFVTADTMKHRTVQVFTRSLNPCLWDLLYAPLVDAGAIFVEVADMAEGAPRRIRSPDMIAAFFDFGADDPGSTEVARIPVRAPAAVPFQLLRPIAQRPAGPGDAFWKLAQGRVGDF